MTEDEKNRHDSEYQSLLALYIALLGSLDDAEDSLFELAELRADQAIGYVVEGLDIDLDEALNLLHNNHEETLTQHDKDMRDRVGAAITNIIDFSVCEEYQLYDETLDIAAMDGNPEVDLSDYEDYLLLCEKYNDTYAAVENADIKYAGMMAAWWITMSAADWVTYWTQNDAKVRPWHMSLQGYTAPRDEFPSWMIPPIEYNCRCFLESYEPGRLIGKIPSVLGKAQSIKKPKQLSDVYSESLAKCGRIFGPSHNYFTVKEADKEMLQRIVSRLREKYYGQA